MSILTALPPPTRSYESAPAASSELVSPAGNARIVKAVPPYGRRKGFVPRKLEDFGDGGAFPEVHVAQYPLDMGRPDKPKSDTKTLAITMNAEGDINYDAIVRQGQNKDKIIYSDHRSLVPKVDMVLDEEGLMRPDDEEVQETAKDTWAALQKVVGNKIQASQPTTLPSQPGAPQYIKYTPSQQGSQYNSGAKSRVIALSDIPTDPLEPPKFRHKKVPRGAGSPPVPVMHSPPRPVTAKDQADWKIPPCISNWKNPKGYTIPLDKRLASDGRGLQETQINSRFAGMAAALAMAEDNARKEIELAAKLQREMLQREKEKKERELRELAMRARMERAGVDIASRLDTGGAAVLASGGDARHADERDDDDDNGYHRDHGYARDNGRERHNERERDNGRERDYGREDYGRGEREYGARDRDEHETREEREERRKRDELREERRRERERERRLEAKEAHGGRRSKVTRDRERDISEKVALGMANVGATGEGLYDSRLFNQDQGMGTGFGSEDAYNVYDKALFTDRSDLYKVSRKADEEGSRAAPVEFEKNEQEADPFGLDAFLSDVKSGKRKRGGDE